MVIQLSKLIEIQGFIRAKIAFHGFRRYCKLPQISVQVAPSNIRDSDSSRMLQKRRIEQFVAFLPVVCLRACYQQSWGVFCPSMLLACRQDGERIDRAGYNFQDEVGSSFARWRIELRERCQF